VPKPKRKHHASIREPQRYGELLVSIDSYGRRSKVEVANEYALKLLPLVWPRNSELRYGRWSEINFVTAEWRFPPERMKRVDPHVIPLARQALGYLRELYQHTGHQEYIFPCQRTGRPLRENAMTDAIKAMGFPDMTAHGVRSFASTMLHEHLWPHAAIEIQLAHLINSETEAAYNYARFMRVRRLMMQWYADYLDSLKARTSKPAIPFGEVRIAIAEESFMHDPAAIPPVAPALGEHPPMGVAAGFD
jgi:integrase